MNYKLPPLPEAINDNRKYGRAGLHVSNGPVYTAEQTQAYAIAVIEAQSVPNVNAEFNRAINFAIEQGIEAAVFLRCWREGDTGEWPEFTPMLAPAPPTTQADMRIPDAVEHYGGVKSDEELFPTLASVVQQEPMASAQVVSMNDMQGVVDWLPHNGAPIKVGDYLYTRPAQQAKPHPLSDEQIAEIFSVRRGAVTESHLLGCARAIESAACADRDARIAELEEENKLLNSLMRSGEQRGISKGIEEGKERIAELERQLEEARKQIDVQKDEWLSWEAKRKVLEKDAKRMRTPRAWLWTHKETGNYGIYLEDPTSLGISIESEDYEWVVFGVIEP